VIWVVIEDVTNPREEGRAPASGAIQITAVNVPEGYLAEDLPSVTVEVRASQRDLATLRPSDFRAEVDLADIEPGARLVTLPVEVSARRDGVEVLEVFPATVDVTLVEAFTAEKPVTVTITEAPPSGFRIKQVDGKPVPADVDPEFVTLYGSEELVERVDRVELEVSLADARQGTYTADGELVARAMDGTVIQVVRMSATEATATFSIEPDFSPLTLGLFAETTGRVARGYHIVEVIIEPATVEATGPQAIIDGLQGPLVLEPVDVTNATTTLRVPRNVSPPPNVEISVSSAIVQVVIEPQRCAGVEAVPCVRATFLVDVALAEVPAGLVPAAGVLRAEVHLAGTPEAMDALIADVTQLRGTVSLANAQPGTASYTPSVSFPAGIFVLSLGSVEVTLEIAGP
jgi:YbbR domain-containing protein